VRRFQQATAVFVLAALVLIAPSLSAGTVRVTTWNLEWFPNGKPKELPAAEQDKRIAAAADVLRPLHSDIILLQEVRDYDVCARLGEMIQPGAYHVAICSAFREPFTPGIGKQQVAILAKEPAQAAWSESWKHVNGVDPPRGFAFAWFKIGGADVAVYSVHLKSNLIMKGDKVSEARKNIRKREVAIEQLLNHIREVITPSMPTVKSFVVGGDFNTNVDQPDFAEEKTIAQLTAAGFRNSMEGIPAPQRVTHPGSGPYPDATFDYLFGSNIVPTKLQIIPSHASDHLPVTCDFSTTGTNAQIPPAPAGNTKVAPPAPAPAPATPAAAPAPPAPAAAPQFVTLTEPVKIKIPYGEMVLPRGLKLPVVSRNAETVTVKYLDGTQTIPVRSTDLQ
jgi:endonuclease/exonuclease/phosphatase family metal-dependent hydrolase